MATTLPAADADTMGVTSAVAQLRRLRATELRIRGPMLTEQRVSSRVDAAVMK